MSEDPMLGRVLADRFEIVSLIGRGGMASVYQALDTLLDRIVAIKVFAVDTSEDRARLESEVRLLSGLNHPNLVTVHDAHFAVGADDGPSFLVMEFVSGKTLRESIATSVVSGDLIVAVASGIGEALHVVHEAGIVHRDVKPANILIEVDAPTTNGARAKLADFGVAHSLGSSHLTATATVIGTAAYLSPEQAAGAAITSASDIYSLGLVLLECFTGQMEYPGTAAESLAARLGRDPEIPPALPAGWSALLRAMLARDPAARPTALQVARQSAVLGSELAAIYPGSRAESDEVPKTRVMPVEKPEAPSSRTAPTRLMTSQMGRSHSEAAKPAAERARFPNGVTLIALAVVLLAVVMISIVLALSQSARTPAPAV
ncbi:MAG: eukaryotic-like serine/threonine-protein kinase, partial [Actinomycetota bacterium]|nr:eukaryotic-like serine/threonine-protein kinase [Actinomycetota bacterium]